MTSEFEPYNATALSELFYIHYNNYNEGYSIDQSMFGNLQGSDYIRIDPGPGIYTKHDKLC